MVKIAGKGSPASQVKETILTTGSTYNETEILHRVQQGDQAAFRALVEHHEANIFTTALKYLHIPALAEETVQDIFLIVWVKRATLNSIDNFGAWLNIVSRNTIYASFHKQLAGKRLNISSLIELPSIASLPSPADHQLLEKEYAAILREAVDRLPAKQKMTYILIKEQGFSREEAARQLKVTPETVKSNLDDAIRKVRAFCMIRLGHIPFIIWLMVNNKI